MHKRKVQPESQKPSTDKDDLQHLRISEVADLLNIGRSSVYRLIHQEGLPAVPLGSKGELRVRQASLRQWVAEREATPSTETAVAAYALTYNL